MLEPKDYPARAEDAFNRRDLDALAALWSDDFHYEAPGTTTDGRAAALAREQAIFAAFPDVRAELACRLASTDGLVLEGRFRGTHRGPLQLGAAEIAATGRAIDVPFAAVFEMRGGRATRERVYYDRLALLQQLGLAPADGAVR